MLLTVIKGPPECSRTRFPGCYEAAVGFGIPVFDKAGSENAGTDKGILNATPGVSTVAVNAGFVNANMANSIYHATDLGVHFVSNTKLNFRSAALVVRISARASVMRPSLPSKF